MPTNDNLLKCLTRSCAKHLKEDNHRAEAGEGRLKQVGTDEGGKEEPVLVHKDRAGTHSQSQAQQNKGAGYSKNNTINTHNILHMEIVTSGHYLW